MMGVVTMSQCHTVTGAWPSVTGCDRGDRDGRDNRDERDERDGRDGRDERDNNEVGHHLSLLSLRPCGLCSL